MLATTAGPTPGPAAAGWGQPAANLRAAASSALRLPSTRSGLRSCPAWFSLAGLQPSAEFLTLGGAPGYSAAVANVYQAAAGSREGELRTVGIVMNGVTGRMGTNQHLIRSILAIRAQGGLRGAGGLAI